MTLSCSSGIDSFAILPGEEASAYSHGVIAIPRTATPAHVRDNRAALDLHLAERDLAALDRAFPPPTAPQPLEML
jgi:diketogulonate reductase-like aldo/keto reductase